MRYIPIIVSIVGLIIHSLGLLNLIPHPIFIIDLLMFLVDLTVTYGLIKKTFYGYWLAVILYSQQSLMQPYWAYKKYMANFFIIHPFEYYIAPLLVFSSLLILLFNKRQFMLQKA